MSTIPPDEHAPFGADTDEAVSAYLDDELEGFARDHGLTPDAARERLEAWDGLADASRALSVARDRRAERDTAPLDDVTRRRLVRAAADASVDRDLTPAAERDAGPTRRRWVIPAIAVAAATALAIGIAVVAGAGDDGSSTASRSSAPKTVESAADAPFETLGDITDPTTLRARLESGHTKQTAPDRAGGLATDAPADARRSATSAATATEEQARACAPRLASGRPLVFLATATYRGAPVVVVAIRDRDRTAAFVADPTTCEVVTFQSR